MNGRCTLVVLAIAACGGDAPREPAAASVGPTPPGTPVDGNDPQPADATANLALTPARAALAKTAGSVVDRIGQLEQQRDVTCWTSFRQLDNFIAELTYSDAATLTKIVASKALLEAIWIAATNKAAGAPVDA